MYLGCFSKFVALVSWFYWQKVHLRRVSYTEYVKLKIQRNLSVSIKKLDARNSPFVSFTVFSEISWESKNTIQFLRKLLDPFYCFTSSNFMLYSEAVSALARQERLKSPYKKVYKYKTIQLLAVSFLYIHIFIPHWITHAEKLYSEIYIFYVSYYLIMTHINNIF